jgi:hypothetical protein
MIQQYLIKSVEDFVAVTQDCNQTDLEREWTWGDYSEGVRFSFFRVYEELRTLAARLSTLRASSGNPVTTAQHILAQHHASFRDLKAVFLGVSDEAGVTAPAEGDWSLREVLVHIIAAERTFFAINLDALKCVRTRGRTPPEMTDDAWDTFWSGDDFQNMKENAPVSALMAYYENLHSRVIKEFSGIRDSELHTPVIFWESKAMPLEFRLHRFDAHLRQHTIQAEKTVLAVMGVPSEAKQLARIVLAALAEVEGILFGLESISEADQVSVADRITDYTTEIAVVLTE